MNGRSLTTSSGGDNKNNNPNDGNAGASAQRRPNPFATRTQDPLVSRPPPAAPAPTIGRVDLTKVPPASDKKHENARQREGKQNTGTPRQQRGKVEAGGKPANESPRQQENTEAGGKPNKEAAVGKPDILKEIANAKKQPKNGQKEEVFLISGEAPKGEKTTKPAVDGGKEGEGSDEEEGEEDEDDEEGGDGTQKPKEAQGRIKNLKKLKQGITQKLRVNEEIVGLSEVFLIGPDGNLGVMPISEAFAKAKELELDLVEVGRFATPPAVRMMDFAAFVLEKKKATKERQMAMGSEKKAGRKLHEMQPMKEIVMGTNIDHNDFLFKIQRMREFLEKEHPVKLTIRFKRSNTLAHEHRPKRASELIARAVSDLSEHTGPSRPEPTNVPRDVIVKFFYPKKK
jgi:translation initiation factor IF-3